MMEVFPQPTGEHIYKKPHIPCWLLFKTWKHLSTLECLASKHQNLLQPLQIPTRKENRILCTWTSQSPHTWHCFQTWYGCSDTIVKSTEDIILNTAVLGITNKQAWHAQTHHPTTTKQLQISPDYIHRQTKHPIPPKPGSERPAILVPRSLNTAELSLVIWRLAFHVCGCQKTGKIKRKEVRKKHRWRKQLGEL